MLISATRGSVRVTQKSTAIDLPAGQMCLTEMNVIGTADLNSAGSFTTTRFPRRLLLQVAPRAETQIAQPLGNDRHLGTMIERYVALCTDVGGNLDAPGQMAAAQHLADLVGLFLGPGSASGDLAIDSSVSTAKLNLLKSDILHHLASADLSLETLALANAISPRQAQRLFASTGTTFSEFVLEQRLLLARRLLLSEAGRRQKVSDAAYAAGFNDLSYFHRTFRKRFGVTPSDMQSGGSTDA